MSRKFVVQLIHIAPFPIYHEESAFPLWVEKAVTIEENALGICTSG